jgi:hypothetical protein
MRSRSRAHDVAAEVVPSTDDVLGAVSSVARGDRTQARSLVAATRGRLEAKAREQAGRRLDDALARLRGNARAPAQGHRPPAADDAGMRGARLAAPEPLPALSLRPVRIRLPSGRWVQGQVAPAAARRDDLEALRRITASNTARAFAAIQHNARAIDSLAASQRALAKSVAELRAKCDPALLQGLLQAVGGLELRLGRCKDDQRRALASHRRKVARQQGVLRKQLKLQARSASIQKLNATVSSMQVAAFGTKGDPLARNNLLLAGNELLWGFAGELLEGLGLKRSGQTSAWGWLAPVASLAAGQVVLGNRQHQRFVSGVATGFTPVGQVAVLSVSLQRHIAPALWPSFRLRDDVPVTRQLLPPFEAQAVIARVERGVLAIVLVPAADVEGPSSAADLVQARVAWTVDTGAGDG